MKQATMKFGSPGSRPKPSPKRVATGFDESNLRTAREVLDSPDKYGGPGSITVVWARLVVERIEGQKGTSR